MVRQEPAEKEGREDKGDGHWWTQPYGRKEGKLILREE